jgi:hypothetical protein
MCRRPDWSLLDLHIPFSSYPIPEHLRTKWWFQSVLVLHCRLSLRQKRLQRGLLTVSVEGPNLLQLQIYSFKMSGWGQVLDDAIPMLNIKSNQTSVIFRYKREMCEILQTKRAGLQVNAIPPKLSISRYNQSLKTRLKIVSTCLV